jgi:curved DNA-binding protein CbpA
MGNKLSNTKTDIEVIKILYGMRPEELNSLREELKTTNPVGLDKPDMILKLRQNQTKLQKALPQDKFILVNNFINQVSKDIEYLREKKTYESQKQRRQNYNEGLKSFKNSKIDGKRLFKLGETYTMDELKISYRNLARRYHPDKPEGNNDKFQLITKAYMTLIEELKTKEKDKPFEVLKQQSKDFYNTQNNNSKQNVKMKVKGGRFDPKLFNKIYEDNRLHDVNNEGYESWIKKTKLEEREIEKPKVFSENFNINVFNNIFEKQVKNTYEMVQFKEPEAQSLDNFSNTNILLGADKIDNYSGGGFTDFKEAHSTSRLISPSQFKDSISKRSTSLDQLKQERGNITKLTEEELKFHELKKQKEQQSDLDRQHQLEQQDNVAFSQYNKLNQRMLDNNLLVRR